MGTRDDFETETCVGCGLTVEVDSSAFLEWDADVVGWSTCPDCRVAAALDDDLSEVSGVRRAA